MEQPSQLQDGPIQEPPFYQELGKSIFEGESERSVVDKLLGRKDADKLHSLMQKEPLTKSDVEEILFLMTSIDQKILNYNEWDRYVIVKLFPWVKDYSTICKTWMIYEEQFKKGEFDEDFVICEKQDITKKGVKPILVDTKDIISEITKYLQHNLKFLISIFLLVSNSTLSIDGAAFETLTTSKFEYSYPTVPLPQPNQRQSIMGNMFSRRR